MSVNGAVKLIVLVIRARKNVHGGCMKAEQQLLHAMAPAATTMLAYAKDQHQCWTHDAGCIYNMRKHKDGIQRKTSSFFRSNGARADGVGAMACMDNMILMKGDDDDKGEISSNTV
jgi:hypothetical protein